MENLPVLANRLTVTQQGEIVDFGPLKQLRLKTRYQQVAMS